MTDSGEYTLSNLARRTRRSKATLLEMLADGRLVGTRADDGRREWRITDDAARAAGLAPQHDATIDAALHTLMADVLDPWGETLLERLCVIEQRIAAIDGQIPDAGHPHCACWCRRVVAVMSSMVRLSRARGGV